MVSSEESCYIEDAVNPLRHEKYHGGKGGIYRRGFIRAKLVERYSEDGIGICNKADHPQEIASST